MEYYLAYLFLGIFALAVPLFFITRSRAIGKVPLTESQIAVVYWVGGKVQVMSFGVIEVKNGFLVLYDKTMQEVGRLVASDAVATFSSVRGNPWVISSRTNVNDGWTVSMAANYAWKIKKGSADRDKFGDLLTANGVEIRNYNKESLQAGDRKRQRMLPILLFLIAALIILQIVSRFFPGYR